MSIVNFIISLTKNDSRPAAGRRLPEGRGGEQPPNTSSDRVVPTFFKKLARGVCAYILTFPKNYAKIKQNQQKR